MTEIKNGTIYHDYNDSFIFIDGNWYFFDFDEGEIRFTKQEDDFLPERDVNNENTKEINGWYRYIFHPDDIVKAIREKNDEEL